MEQIYAAIALTAVIVFFMRDFVTEPRYSDDWLLAVISMVVNTGFVLTLTFASYVFVGVLL
jgi:hypothetical protein